MQGRQHPFQRGQQKEQRRAAARPSDERQARHDDASRGVDRHQQPVAWQAVSQTRDERREQAGREGPRQAGQADLDDPPDLVRVDEQGDHEGALRADPECPCCLGQPDLPVREGLAQRARRCHRRMIGVWIRGSYTLASCPFPRAGYTPAYDGTEHGRLPELRRREPRDVAHMRQLRIAPP